MFEYNSRDTRHKFLCDEFSEFLNGTILNIGGAALDVFENEPLPKDSILRNLENVFLSPHNSNGSVEVFNKVDLISIENIITALKKS